MIHADIGVARDHQVQYLPRPFIAATRARMLYAPGKRYIAGKVGSIATASEASGSHFRKLDVDLPRVVVALGARIAAKQFAADAKD
ncbi:MAG: hypothetical protein V4475_10355 [Pseudomonadota bacterium]